MSYGRELERIADALEKLVDDSVVEIDAGPPICPHCGDFDPTVVFSAEAEQEGKLSQFIICAVCQSCGNTMYAAIDSFSMHRGLDTLRNEFESKAGMTDE